MKEFFIRPWLGWECRSSWPSLRAHNLSGQIVASQIATPRLISGTWFAINFFFCFIHLLSSILVDRKVQKTLPHKSMYFADQFVLPVIEVELADG